MASTATARPKIGLALGGGGARGFAHIGVLEWLEAHHIPVDCIAGTSMGGIIGALYTAGMSPADMRRELGGVDWTGLFTDRPPYEQLAFRRKDDRREFPSGAEIGLHNGVKLPAGLLQGQKISLLFQRLTLPVAGVTDFDRLPIPFRCVAVDMVKAEAVVLRGGSLAQAMRATMAIPGVFAPVELDGRVLADGGLVDNIPTEVVKGMGADIIIAVDVGSPLSGKESLDTLLGVVNQSVGVMILQNVRRSLQLADVVLTPELEGVASADYPAVEAIADRGRSGPEQKAAILSKLAVDEAEYLRLRDSQRAPPARPLVPERIDVEGAQRVPPGHLTARLRPFLGKPLDLPRFEHALADLYGEGRYDSLTWAPTSAGDAQGIKLVAREKRHGPPFLYPGLEVSGGWNDDVRLNVRARVVMDGITGYGAELRGDLGVGNTNRAEVEYFSAMGEHGWFYAPRVYYSSSTTPLFRGNSRVADYRIRKLGGGVDLGWLAGRSDELRLGLDYGQLQTAIHVGDPVLPTFDEGLGVLQLRYRHERLDNPVIPTHGWRMSATIGAALPLLGSETAFPFLDARSDWFQPVSANGSLFVRAQFGTHFEDNSPAYTHFPLGGPLRLSAYHLDQFLGSDVVYGGVGYLHRVWTLPRVLGGKVYAGGWYEVGGAFQRFHHARYVHSISAGLAAETILGPAFFGASWGENGNRRAYLSLGGMF
ncbi:MAG: patatin-like phospholipase family protein [Armatimonadetes bacterium]|nr:patatin-like phospholipase family protein [Armatimonadota bacterium]